MPAALATRRPRRLSTEALQRACDAWNARYAIGTAVTVVKDGGDVVATTTRTAAYVLGGHSAVIMLEGISGCYLLERVNPVLDLAGCEAAAPALRFDEFELDEAHEEWSCSCGPAALAAILGVPLHMARGLMPDFEGRGWTNAVMLSAALDRSRTPWRRADHDGRWPTFGLARIQWGGPWLSPGVPERARLTQTHWVAVAPQVGAIGPAVFDINAMHAGGWITAASWESVLVPELTRGIDRADGTWSISHGIEIEARR